MKWNVFCKFAVPQALVAETKETGTWQCFFFLNSS